MRVRKKFLQLTGYTYPHGTESHLRSYLPNNHKKDQYGNYYVLIGESPTTMFTCHLDTSCSSMQKVKHVQDSTFIRTDGKSILGADDKAGMVVILSMIEKNIPGLYYFFIGEEVGCVGSGRLAQTWEENIFSKTINKIVSFDRRDICSVITHQYYGRCCSDEFAEELSKRLNGVNGLKLSPDDTGVVTDSAKFMHLVPECTNISVGYYNEHTTKEVQDIVYLQKLCYAVCQIDWESLPIFRDPLVIDEDDEDYEEFMALCDDEDEWVEDYYSYFSIDKKTTKMYISKKQIAKEKECLINWLSNMDSYCGFKSISWNGNKLFVQSEAGGFDYVGCRTDLMEFVSEVGYAPMECLKKDLTKKNKKIIL